MKFDLEQGIEILERTPAVLRTLLTDLSEGWLHGNEGGESWSPFEVLGHLIHGEKTDWVVRAEIILEEGESRTFEPFDRFAHLEANRGRELSSLLDEFERLRVANLTRLRRRAADGLELGARGQHPELGRVTLGELLATWVAHDLGHIAQIARVLAKQYAQEVGPWGAYLPVLHRGGPAAEPS